MFDDEDEQELELLRQYEEQEGDVQHQSSEYVNLNQS